MDEKDYTELEPLFQKIMSDYISLNDNERKEYGAHFKRVLDAVIKIMRESDPLFNALYQTIYSTGSYYDGLRVAKPTEFDLDVILNLPVNYDEIEILNKNAPRAYVTIKIEKAFDLLRQHPRWEVYRHMDCWRDDDKFLLQTKVREWMEGVVNKALRTLPKESDSYILTVQNSKDNDEMPESHSYTLSLKKSGPAMTLAIILPDKTQLDVDLVPVLEFKYPKWPPKPVRQPKQLFPDKFTHVMQTDREQLEKPSWFVVPKPKKKLDGAKKDTSSREWRLAFPDQERILLKDKGPLKSIVRLLKKLRDKQGWSNLASYYIKTLFLWEVIEKDTDFWKKSKMSTLFMYMLKKLQEKLEDGKINFFWDPGYNLLDSLSTAEIGNIKGRLKNIIKDIDKKFKENNLIVAEMLLSKYELEEVKKVIVPASPVSPAPLSCSVTDAPTPKKKKDEACKVDPASSDILNEILHALTTMQTSQDVLQNNVGRLIETTDELKAQQKVIEAKINKLSIGETEIDKVSLSDRLNCLDEKLNTIQEEVSNIHSANGIMRDSLGILQKETSMTQYQKDIANSLSNFTK